MLIEWLNPVLIWLGVDIIGFLLILIVIFLIINILRG